MYLARKILNGPGRNKLNITRFSQRQTSYSTESEKYWKQFK